ncbi:hypothetical protein Agub_g11377 [Astrephomene gubernaculifera]|uniref:DUF3593 domain-containing protein n=1 Tax=Astrephomene gubernaculifera TaxID=47775 RepID=A0AAD3HQF9_9CHLO|nr:hypothetical protein Agub_g11377 [Astrephomene gubernaculifera]
MVSSVTCLLPSKQSGFALQSCNARRAQCKSVIAKPGLPQRLLAHKGASRRGLAQRMPMQQQRPVATQVFPFDQAWAPSVDAASVAPQLFAISLFPYLFFLYFLTKSGKTPRLTLIGFYFLLAFVAVTVPAGIYAKTHYGTSLANVDWLHGGAESLLTVTNLLIVLGLRQGIREAEAAQQQGQGGSAQGAGSGGGREGAAAAQRADVDGAGAADVAGTALGQEREGAKGVAR